MISIIIKFTHTYLKYKPLIKITIRTRLIHILFKFQYKNKKNFFFLFHFKHFFQINEIIQNSSLNKYFSFDNVYIDA